MQRIELFDDVTADKAGTAGDEDSGGCEGHGGVFRCLRGFLGGDHDGRPPLPDRLQAGARLAAKGHAPDPSSLHPGVAALSTRKWKLDHAPRRHGEQCLFNLRE